MKRIKTEDGAEMVLIEAGPFIYGASDERLLQLFERKDLVERVRKEFYEAQEEEKYLDAFYIDVFPVTNAQFVKFMKETEYKKRLPYLDDTRFGRPELPVVGVAWKDAVAYVQWAGKQLPSEEQWEKAARGTDGRLFPWGHEYNPSLCNCADVGYMSTSPLGRFSEGRSPYGIEDMAGNVWEMTTGTWFGDAKTMRGGAFLTYLSHCRSTFRWTASPEEQERGATWLSFRCVMPAPKDGV